MDNASPAFARYADAELVLRAQENDHAAFDELVRRTSTSCHRLAVSILRDHQEAEDELQNAYLSAWRHLGQFQREAKFSTWISRIVMNQCLMRLRKLRGVSFLYLDDTRSEERARQPEVPDLGATPEARFRNREMSEVLHREISRLPPIMRNVLVLRDLNEFSTADVAAFLSISAPGVKSRLLRARIELRKRLEKHGIGLDRSVAPA